MSSDTLQAVQAHCFKCKTKRSMQSPRAVYTKTGLPAIRGICPTCGANLFRRGKTAAHESLPKPDITEKPARKKAAKSTRNKKTKTTKKKPARKNIDRLVIVESPAKARSIGGFLGKDYAVMSSKGHVRDLLKSSLSVDVDNAFEPRYAVPKDKRLVVKELKAAAQNASEIFLATDPDREGEAIAWHLAAAASMPASSIKRVVFHEITDAAVADAFSHPRSINMDLVNAQQARRIIDRLVGYKVSSLLRYKARRGLTAGRVQSIALRLVVEREKEIEAFVPVEYWTLDCLLGKPNQNGGKGEFTARLVKINSENVIYKPDSGKAPVLDSAAAVLPHLRLLESVFIVAAVKRGARQRKPSPPFTTSTLQQEAARRFHFSARRTMQIAQQLYEGIDIEGGKAVGLITYMRTDSLQVSSQAQAQARDYVHQNFGKTYTPNKPPKYKTKAKGAQEAHEAIRPTSVMRPPAMMKTALNHDQFRLYTLIWQRFVASQMSNAVYDTIRIEIKAGPTPDSTLYLLRVSGSRLRFPGFLALYDDTRDQDRKGDDDSILWALAPKERLDLRRLMKEKRFTQPPPRYTEASLIRALEEHGIGRPSTYAPTVTLIQSPDRDYIHRNGSQFVPTKTGRLVSDLLSEYFTEEMDYEFTARMEEQLDAISEGKMDWRPMLDAFYQPFERRLNYAEANMPKQNLVEPIGRSCPDCRGGDLIIRYGRWGKFIGCTNYPECRHTEPHLERKGFLCPDCGHEHQGEIVARRTRKGRLFYGCSRYPDCDFSAWQLPKGLAKIEREPESEKRRERSIS